MDVYSDVRGWLTADQIATLRIPGIPKSGKRVHDYAERYSWETRKVDSSGRAGARREYRLPPEVIALVEQRQRGDLPPVPVKEVQYQTMRSGDGRMMMAMEQLPGPFDARRDLLEAVLRVGEYKILHDQVTKHVVEFGLEGAPTWLEAARDFPDLDLRLRNMIATFKFLNAADLS